MTYDEIKKRLTKCELQLKEFQDSTNPARKAKNFDTTVRKLTVLKESLQKQLKETEKGMISTSDSGEAEKFAKKGLNVDLKTEQEGVAFSKEETMAIAKSVGKAVAKAIHSSGDEVSHMKARNIEENSFDIYVQYKNEADDTFSFYISDDTLHLVDFSFDKELVDVGVKPSGEAVVHVDVLANELVKHFKAMQEGMSDQEFADAGEADRLEKHPDKDKIKKIRALIAAQQKNEEMEPETEDLYQHDDEYLDQLKHKKETNEAPEGKYYFEVSQDDSTKALFIMDFMFRPQLEKTGKKGFELSQNVYSFENSEVASAAMKLLQDRSGVEIIDTNIGLDKNEELGLNEAPEGMYYIEVAVRDAKLALEIIDDQPALKNAIQISSSNVFYLNDEQLAYDLYMDFAAFDVEVTDTNIDENNLEEYKSDYTKRREAERDYQPAKKDKPANPHTDPKTNDYFAYRKKRDIEEGDVDAEMDGGDLDIGHQDDEPNMLKQQVYDIATYAAKLYKQLDKYDRYDGEVDFPHWWQKKIILARDYVSAAQHYLEFEEKQPALDALALEEGVDEASHAKLKKEYDELVGKMKQLAQHFKTAEGEKKVKIVSALKQHTARKRELEKQIDAAIGGIGVGQELDPNLGEAQPTGFGTGQGRSKTISKGRETNTNLKSKLSSQESPFRSSKYTMVKGVPHKVGPDGKLVPLNKLSETEEDKDYFEHYDELPKDILKLVDFHQSNLDKFQSAKSIQKLLAKFEEKGWTFDYGLDFDPYGLKPLQELNTNLSEAKATCCGKCGRVHVKGSECKRPFLKGKDHCRYN